MVYIIFDPVQIGLDRSKNDFSVVVHTEFGSLTNVQRFPSAFSKKILERFKTFGAGLYYFGIGLVRSKNDISVVVLNFVP